MRLLSCSGCVSAPRGWHLPTGEMSESLRSLPLLWMGNLIMLMGARQLEPRASAAFSHPLGQVVHRVVDLYCNLLLDQDP